MKNCFSLAAAMITVVLTGSVVTTTGCGGTSIASLCKSICTCARCTDNDLKTCEDKGAQAAANADAAGCSSEFDDAVTCTGAHVSCNGDMGSNGACDAEVNALSKCSATLSVFGKNLCDRSVQDIADKLASCPAPPTNGGVGAPGECTDAAATLLTCQAAAFAAASCDCIGAGNVNKCTSEQAKSFMDAVTACK
ncbi:MAG: hypothetical protein ABJE95_09625 [Byssovorax sp.]